MRPVLIELPSKLLFFAAILLAIVSFVRDRLARRGQAKASQSQPSSTPLYLAIGAWLLLGMRGGAWIPSAETFRHSWLSVPIYSYGVMLGSSMIVGWFLAMKLAKQDGISQEASGAIYMWTAIWSIVGARILYILTNIHEFDSPLDIFKVWKGGLVAYGGMLGGFFASWYGCRQRKIPLLRWADVAAPSVVLGTAITRVGCLLFGCDYGRPTNLPWAIRFPKKAPAWTDHVQNLHLSPDAPYSLPVHPTQVYETLAGLFLFGLLMYLRKVRKFSGAPFLGWVIGYGILRPIIEIYRDDKERGNVGPLTTSQFIGLTSVVLAIILLVHLVKRYRADPEGVRLWEQPLEPAPVVAPPGRTSRRRKGR